MSAVSDTALAHSEDVLAPAPRLLSAAPTRVEREAAAVELRQAFCAHLKATRERRGISRQMISDATNISAGLFSDLERGDLSRWPTGIYRRAFFREYAGRIGLPVDSTLAEFIRLFPDDHERGSDQAALLPGPLRLTLARPLWHDFSPAHVRAAALDIAIILGASGAGAWLMSAGLWTSLASVTLGYYGVGTVLLGCSPATWWIRRGTLAR